MYVALPIEIKIREYVGKILLVFQLLNHKVDKIIIGEKSRVYNIYKNNTGIFLVSKGGPEKSLFIKKKIKKNKLAILDEEGPVINFQDHVLQNRVTKKIFSLIDHYIFWGKKDYRLIEKKLKSKIMRPDIFGHPKFDLCKKPLLDYYNKEINLIKKKYKKFIFFSSSFGSDQTMPKHLYDNYILKNLQKNNLKNKKTVINEREREHVDYIKSINAIVVLAKKFPYVNFIFRPHPRQNLDLVKMRFKNKKNIHVIYKYTTIPWIAACELYIHSGCTTVFEAVSLKKKIIFYYENSKKFRPKLFYDFGKYCKNVERLIINVRNKNDIKSNFQLKEYINNSKNNFFYEGFVNLIKKNLKKNDNKKIFYNRYNYSKLSKFLSLIKKKIFEIKFMNKIVFFFDKEILLSENYKKQKIGVITKKEIQKDLLIFSKIFKKKIKYKIKQLDRNLFLIKNEKKNSFNNS